MITRQKAILTPEGKAKLEKELADLRSRRPQIVNEVQIARAMGDLRENSAYQANKEKLRSTDRRITRLELTLRNSEVVEKRDTDEAQLGSLVRVEFNGQELEYSLVGDNEADPKTHCVSLHSPLGKAFMGRKKGERVEVFTPLGKNSYIIKDIK